MVWSIIENRYNFFFGNNISFLPELYDNIYSIILSGEIFFLSIRRDPLLFFFKARAVKKNKK